MEDLKTFLDTVGSEDTFSGYDYITYRKYILSKYDTDPENQHRQNELINLKQKLEQKLKKHYKDIAVYEKNNLKQSKIGDKCDYVTPVSTENVEKEYLKSKLDH